MYKTYNTLKPMKPGFKGRAGQLRTEISTHVDNLRRLCHSTGCNFHGCPDLCDCKKWRANPLNLETALIWKLADYFSSVSRILYDMSNRYALAITSQNSKEGRENLGIQLAETRRAIRTVYQVAGFHRKHRLLNLVAEEAMDIHTWVQCYLVHGVKSNPIPLLSIRKVVAKNGRRRHLGGKVKNDN